MEDESSSEIELVELTPVNLSHRNQRETTSTSTSSSPCYLTLDWRSSEIPSQVSEISPALSFRFIILENLT